MNDRVSLERVYIGWPTPEYFSADDAALDIAARVLADGLSSRLNKALVYDKPLATQVSSFNITGEIASVFVVQATARPGSSLAEIEKTVTAEIARLAKEGPTAAELERSKTKQEAEFVSGLERIGGFGGKADVLNQYNTFLGDPNKIEADLTRYRSLTTASVQQAVGKWLDTPNRVLIRFHPEKSQRPVERADARPERRCRRSARIARSRRRRSRRRSWPTASSSSSSSGATCRRSASRW